MPTEALEIRLRFVDGCDFKTLGNGILKDFEKYGKARKYITVSPDNHEGCRVNYDENSGNGWILLRMSLHEPILPINVESDSAYGALKMAKDLYYFLKKYPCLNVTPLQDAIEEEKTLGHATHVLRVPRWLVLAGFSIIKCVSKNKSVFLRIDLTTGTPIEILGTK